MVLAGLFGSLIWIAVASVWLFSMSVAGRNTVELIQDGFTLVPMGRHGVRGRQLEIYRL